MAFGVEDREREIYKLWEDNAPSFVLEVTSKTTSGEDDQKKVRYARWGVNEVFLYDPRSEYVKPPLQGFRLSDRTYRAMAVDILANGKPGFASEALGLGLWLDRSVLRFHDPETWSGLVDAEGSRGEGGGGGRAAAPVGSGVGGTQEPLVGATACPGGARCGRPRRVFLRFARLPRECGAFSIRARRARRGRDRPVPRSLFVGRPLDRNPPGRICYGRRVNCGERA